MPLDPTDQRGAILGLPAHVRDAHARVQTAAIETRPSAGLVIAGMGGSAIGGDLGAAAIGDRATGPIVAARGYTLPPWVDEHWTVLLSSYSGNTEETLACWDAAGDRGARRIVAAAGGELADRAAAAGVPAVELPGGFQPRAAVGYATVVAMEAARLAGVAPDLAGEVLAAADHVEALSADCETEARVLAGAIGAKAPVVYGAELSAPAAYRLKCQVNENANRAAFASVLPEANHNEVEGWGDRTALVPLFLVDPVDTHPRVLTRFALTADIAGGALRAEATGATRTERLLHLVHLGDLVTLHLAYGDGTDPESIPALLDLKARL